MKTLKELLNESLAVLEAKTGVIVAFNHENPERTFVIKNSTDKDLSKLHNTSFNICDICTDARGLVAVRHDDENLYVFGTGHNNLNSLSKRCWQEYQEQTSQWNDLKDGEEVEIEFGDLGLGLGWDYNSKETEKSLWKKHVESYIKNSYIDGDSAKAYVLLDLNKNQVVLGDGMDIIFFDSFDEFWEELFEEE